MGDFNIQFKWAEAEGEVVPGEMSVKWSDLRQIATEAGFQQVTPAPAQMHLPTFYSRKGNVTNTQIDGAFVSNSSARHLRIEEESRNEVGTDHDRVAVQAWVRGMATKRVAVGGPRVVTTPIPDGRKLTTKS